MLQSGLAIWDLSSPSVDNVQILPQILPVDSFLDRGQGSIRVATATNDIIESAEKRLMEDIRLRATLLLNEEWRRQMNASHRYFNSGKEGHSLSDLGR